MVHSYAAMPTTSKSMSAHMEGIRQVQWFYGIIRILGWMLNEDKTQIIWLGTRQQLEK